MEEIRIINLEGRDFIITKEVPVGDIIYVLLLEENNPKHFCIRKVINRDNKQLLIGLDNEEEFDKALELFAKLKEN